LLAGFEDVVACGDDVSVCSVAVGTFSDTALGRGDGMAECRLHSSRPVAQRLAPTREGVNFIVMRPCMVQKPSYFVKTGFFSMEK
jgi:hypothetical protein